MGTIDHDAAGRFAAGTGKPSKLTDKVKAELVGYLRAGAYQATAANRAGVNPRTMRKWLERGRAAWDNEAEGGEVQEAERPYLAFAKAAEQAIAQAELDLLAKLQEAPSGQWQKFAWRLERRWPDRYSLQQRSVVTVEHTGPDPVSVFGDGNMAQIAAKAEAEWAPSIN